MSDVFVICVPITGAYPSVNNLGADGYRGGRKTDEYQELQALVIRASKEEMNRTGWKKATYCVSGSITRYQRSAHGSDASNLGKGECDALEAAGVVENDTLIRPIVKNIEYDPNGEDRIVIVLQRLFPRLAEVKAAKAATQVKPIKTLPPVTKAPKLGVAYVNGIPVPYGEALREAEMTGDYAARRRA